MQRTMMRSCASGLVLFLLIASAVDAAAPQLGAIQPPGAQRGTDVELLFNGARLKDAQEVLFYYPGVTVNKLEVAGDNQVKVNVKIAPDCRLGEHAVRLRAASGVSELQTFYVGPLPTVAEVDPNSEFTAPQKLDLNVTVNGAIQGDDVDYFVVEAKKGQRLTAQIEGIRLGRILFDPYVAILDSKRFELAVSDDNPLVRQDSIASIIVPEDGQYTIQVRESAYRAPGDSPYRLHVGTFPQPTAVMPTGGKPGEEVEVKFLGDVAGEIVQKVKLPAETDDNFMLFVQDATGIAPTGVPFRLSDLTNVIENEPNEAAETGTTLTAPAAVSGIIGQPGDIDFFRFAAKKGEVYDIHCYARRIRSPLDSVMNLGVVGGGGLAGSDDAGNPDSYVRFTVPEDKEYWIRIADHLNKGGPNYTYRVEITPVKPTLTVSIPKVRQFSQERQTIVIPKGNRYASLMSGTRTDFGGELVLTPANLPAGVTATSDNIPDGIAAVPMLFEAAADAPLANSMATVSAKHIDPNVQIPSIYRQTTEMVYGQNQTVFWSHTVDKLSVAVTEEAPFKINIVEPKVPLVQNGSMGLKIVAERKEGFTAPITLEMLFNPPGVSSASSVAIPEGQNEAIYPLNANGNASVRKWKIALTGSAPVDGGTVVVSTQLATLEIAPPLVQFAIERAAAEQGQEAKIFCKLTHNTPFEGAAKAQFLGLPAKVTAPELELTKDTQELIFPVKIDPASPAGRHQNIICQVVVMQNGEPITHTVGATELRIDTPKPPKANEPPKPVEVAQAPPPMPEKTEKPLSRLEQLRLEAQQKAAQGK